MSNSSTLNIVIQRHSTEALISFCVNRRLSNQNQTLTLTDDGLALYENYFAHAEPLAYQLLREIHKIVGVDVMRCDGISINRNVIQVPYLRVYDENTVKFFEFDVIEKVADALDVDLDDVTYRPDGDKCSKRYREPRHSIWDDLTLLEVDW